MRGLFSLVGLVVVLAIVGLVIKRQLAATAPQGAASAASSSTPHLNTAEQRQQLQKQVQDDVNQLMQGRPADIDQRAEPKP